MNKKLILPEDKKETEIEVVKDNVVPFLKPDWQDQDPDWLWSLPQGAVFLVQPKQEKDQYGRTMYNPQLLEFHVLTKVEPPRAVKLLSNLNNDQIMWVDSRLFSLQFKLHKVIYVDDNRTDQSIRLEDIVND
jgi:hypothetical protein